jgi:signal transduction histidine kinase
MLLCFSIFVFFFHHHYLRQQQQAMQSHAKVIEIDLWSLDHSGPVEYLSLASAFHNYVKISITNHSKDEFVSVDGPSLEKLDQILDMLGLLPVTVISVDVKHKGEKIGQLIAQSRNMNIYVYFYVFMFFIMTYIAIILFLRTTYVKYQLEKNELNRILFEYSPLETIVVDSEGKVISFNLAMRNAKRKIPEIGQVMYKDYAANHSIDMFTEMMKCIETGDNKEFTNLPYGAMFLNITLSNFPNGAIIACQDITEQVRIEELLVQNEKMLSLGGLAAGMAHEVNNPLAGIMQTTNVMSNRLTSDNMPANIAAAENVGTSIKVIQAYMEQRGIIRMLDAIKVSGERVADIVTNMLNFARKSDKSFSSHSLNTLLDKSLELCSTDYDLKKHYDFKSITIIKEYDDNLPLVACEEGKIEQVFLNLFRNGAEAMQEAGTTPATFTIQTTHNAELNMVTVTIEDNGPGINEKIRKRIFEPFFTTKPVGVGTGLGLSVSFFIITENHGGEMTVESELGKRTKFFIRLPCEQIETTS